MSDIAVKFLSRFSKYTSALAIAFGMMVLTGWALHIQRLKGIVSGQVAVKANTGVCFVLIGVALWLAKEQREKRYCQVLRKVLAAAVSMVGLLSFLECWYGWDLRIDQMLFPAGADDLPGSVRPGLMSPIAALDFLLLGIAVMLLEVAERWSRWAQALFAGVAAVASVFGILDFVLDPGHTHTHIAPLTAALLFLFSFAVLCARAEWGLGKLFASESPGGELSRRLLPAAIVVPIVIGWLRWKGQESGLYSDWAGLVIMVASSGALLAGLTVWTALVLERIEQKRVAAEESVRRLASIVMSSNDAIIGHGLDRKMTSWNPGAEAIFGYAAEEMIGQAATRIIPPNHMDEFEGFLQRLGNGESIRHYETERTRKGGRTVPVSVSISPLKDGNGKVIGACTIARDISERKQAEATIAGERRRFEAVLDSLPVMICLLRPDYSVAFANHSFRRQFGDAKGRKCYEFCYGKAAPCEFCQAFEVLKDGQPIDWEVATNDGRRVHAFDFPFADTDGSPLILEMDVDITEQKEAEQKLREASRYSRSLLEASLDPLVAISKEGKITDVNQGTEMATGLSRDRLIGSDFSDYFTEPEKAREGYEQVFEKGLVRDYPLAIRHSSGKVMEVLYNASVFKNAEGEVDGVFAAARDITERRRAEEALRVERQRFRDVLDRLPVYVALLTPDYHVALDNSVFRERFGESKGRPCYEFLFNRNTPCETCETYNVLKTGVPQQWKWTGPDGRHYDIFDFPFTDSDGSPLILEMGMDVTERRRAEAALQESEERFRTLSDVVPQLVWMCTPDGLNIYFNQRWFDYTGLSPEQCHGRKWSTPFHPEDQQPAWNAWNHAVATGGTYKIDVRLRSVDGGYRWFLTKGLPMRDASGKILRWFGTCTDIDDRKRAEEEIRKLNCELEKRVEQRTAELKESEQRVRRKLDAILVPEGDLGTLELGDILDIPTVQSLLEHFHSVVHLTSALIDLKGKFLAAVGLQDICKQFHRTHPDSCRNCVESDVHLSSGIPEGEVRIYKCKNLIWDAATPVMVGGQHLGNLFCGQFFFDDEVVDYDAFRAQAKQYGFDEETYMTALDAVPRFSRHTVQASMSFLAMLARILSQLSYSSIQLARSTEQVGRTNAELTASVKELEAFTYSVSHDLRAPLRHISGFSKILGEEFAAALPPEARHHVQRIQDGTRRMGQLVDDLLNLGRVGRKELSLQVAGLRSIADEVIASLKPDTSDRNVEWQIRDLPYVECDTALMQQVFQNLLSNAVKFTRPREHAVIEIGQEQRDGSSVVYVRDNGVGFSMKYAGKLFGVFQRLHRSEDFEGTGVGLAIVQRIIQKHGGRIWAEGELDKGAAFYFTLGAGEAEAAAPQAVSAGKA